MDYREKLITYARQIGMTEETFNETIADMYAGIVDMRLDDLPDSTHEQTSIFPGHKLVITSRREFLN